MPGKNLVNNQDGLLDFLIKSGVKAPIKMDMERALSSYAALHGIQVGSFEWKSINLKLMLPSLQIVSSRWRLIQADHINTT